MKTLLIEKSDTLHQYREYNVINIEGERIKLLSVYPILEHPEDPRPTYAVKVNYSPESSGIMLFQGYSVYSAEWCKGDIYWDSSIPSKDRYITLVGLMEADNLEAFLSYFVKTMCQQSGSIQLAPSIENRTFTSKEFADTQNIGQFYD